MELLLWLFKSGLPDEELSAVVDAGAEQYRHVPGLILKFDVQDPSSTQRGSVFVFDSKANRIAFQASSFAQSARDAYQIVEPPVLRELEITRALITNTVMTLHE